MLAEFIHALGALQERATAAQLVMVPGEVRKRHLQIMGELQELEIEAPQREHPLADIRQVAALIKLYGLERAAVFVSATVVELMLDQDDRHERCRVGLFPTKQCSTLHALDGRAMDPPTLRRLLMFELWGVLPTALVSSLLKVDFSRSERAAGSASHGAESLGRTIEAKAQGMEAIPETVRVTFAPWRRIPVQVPVELGIILDVKAGGIGLCPLAGQLEEAMDLANFLLCKELEDGLAKEGLATPVIRGAMS